MTAPGPLQSIGVGSEGQRGGSRMMRRHRKTSGSLARIKAHSGPAGNEARGQTDLLHCLYFLVRGLLVGPGQRPPWRLCGTPHPALPPPPRGLPCQTRASVAWPLLRGAATLLPTLFIRWQIITVH